MLSDAKVRIRYGGMLLWSRGAVDQRFGDVEVLHLRIATCVSIQSASQCYPLQPELECLSSICIPHLCTNLYIGAYKHRDGENSYHGGSGDVITKSSAGAPP